MMIIVPTFAHADETGNWDIIALRSRAFDDPGLAAFAMREMADQPVPGDTDRNARTDAPN